MSDSKEIWSWARDWPTDHQSQNNLNLNLYERLTEHCGDLALQVEGVSNETAEYGLSSVGLGPESDCSGKAQKQLYE
jgi:hypothetical protein